MSVIVYSIDIDLQEYIEGIDELNDEKTATEILREHLENKTNDEDINNELINAAEKPLDATDEERPVLDLLVSMQSIEDPIIYEITQLVLRSDKVRIRTIQELEETGQDDPILANKWIYHKDFDLKKVLNYIRNQNDFFRKEDEREEEDNLK